MTEMLQIRMCNSQKARKSVALIGMRLKRFNVIKTRQMFGDVYGSRAVNDRVTYTLRLSVFTACYG